MPSEEPSKPAAIAKPAAADSWVPSSTNAPRGLLNPPETASLMPQAAERVPEQSPQATGIATVAYNSPLGAGADFENTNWSAAITPLPPIDDVVAMAGQGTGAGGISPRSPISLAAAREAETIPPPPDQPHPRLEDRLKIPPDLPGATAAKLQLPPYDIEHPQRRSKIIDELFPEPPAIMRLATPRLDVAGTPMTLRQLQDIALQSSPLLPQVAGDVTSALGVAVQRGTHPNPTIGYEADTVGSFGTRNYQGVFGTQTIKTAGKLGLARAAANFDAMNAQLNFRKTRAQLLADVRAGYFAVLVAQESVAINSALVQFTTEVYRIQVDKLKAGSGAGYEPAQMRTLTVQAKAALVQAQNRYVSAWKQLAATVGRPEIPPTELEGRADMPVPTLNYEAVLTWVINNHPDVLAGRNSVSQVRTNLRLQEVTPVPDLQLYGTFQKDYTLPGFQRTSYNVQFGVPVPIFDRNRGNIISAQGDLRRASQESRRAQNSLTAQLADAFERFETSRVQTQFYHDQILPDLARAYRGVYQRHQQESIQVGFGDIIVAQQNLAVAIAAYVTALGGQWAAVTDISNLMQLDDLWVLYGANRPAEIEQNVPAKEAPAP